MRKVSVARQSNKPCTKCAEADREGGKFLNLHPRVSGKCKVCHCELCLRENSGGACRKLCDRKGPRGWKRTLKPLPQISLKICKFANALQSPQTNKIEQRFPLGTKKSQYSPNYPSRPGVQLQIHHIIPQELFKDKKLGKWLGLLKISQDATYNLMELPAGIDVGKTMQDSFHSPNHPCRTLERKFSGKVIKLGQESFEEVSELGQKPPEEAPILPLREVIDNRSIHVGGHTQYTNKMAKEIAKKILKNFPFENISNSLKPEALAKLQRALVNLIEKTRKNLGSGKITLNQRCAELQKERSIKSK